MTNAGTQQQAVFNFVLQQGPHRPCGVQGRHGRQGRDRPHGSDRPDRRAGSIGPTGPGGAQGNVGPTGPTGKDGAQGATGSTTLQQTATTGVCYFDIPSYGTWNVTGTLNGKTDTQTVTVDQVKQYAVTLKYAKTYGAIWDGTATTAWSRTDDAAGFADLLRR